MRRNKGPEEILIREEIVFEALRHPLLPPCVRAAGPFAALYLAEVLPTLGAWRPGAELVKEHQALHQLFTSVGSPGALLPQVIARALTHLGHQTSPPAGLWQPFFLYGEGQQTISAVVVAPDLTLPKATCALHQAMLRHRLTWGILSDGKRWQLHVLSSSGFFLAPYEVDPTEVLAAPFFSEAFRYFSLFFRASAFTGFLSQALSGSLAIERASEQSLQERLLPFAEDPRWKGNSSLVTRALFLVLFAARGFSPFLLWVRQTRSSGSTNVSWELLQPLISLKDEEREDLRSLVLALTPEDPSDPDGLQDARLSDPLSLLRLCGSFFSGDASWISRWLSSQTSPEAAFFALDTATELLPSLLLERASQSYQRALRAGEISTPKEHLQREARALFACSESFATAALIRYTMLLSGASPQEVSSSVREGFLAVDHPSWLSAWPSPQKKQPSLFGSLAAPIIEAARDAKDERWLRALADARAAEQKGEYGGYEALLSLTSNPVKLLAQYERDGLALWVRDKKPLHWWLDMAQLSGREVIFLVAPTAVEEAAALTQRLLALSPKSKVCLRLSPSVTQKKTGASVRSSLLAGASLHAVLDHTSAGDWVILGQRQSEPVDVSFSRLVSLPEAKRLEEEAKIPEEGLVQPPGAPWTPLRDLRILSLAARIRARCQRLRSLLVEEEPAQLFLTDQEASLQPRPGAAGFRVREETLAPEYLIAASLSSALRLVLLLEEASLLELPVPIIRGGLTPKQRSAEKKALQTLLLAGRYQTLLEKISQHLLKGSDAPAHDLLSEVVLTGRGLDSLVQPIFSLLLGLSSEEEALVEKHSPRPSLPAPPRPLPIRPPSTNIDATLRAMLLEALRQKGTLTSHEAQGVTGLDSRRLRILLADLELSGELARSGHGRGTLYHAVKK